MNLNFPNGLSDAMVEAVGGEDDAILGTAFEMGILMRRQFMFGAMQQILDEGLGQFGIYC